LLGEIRKRATLEEFELDSLELDRNMVHFPAIGLAFCKDFDDEEEYVWVDVSDHVRLCGTQEVQEGLMLMEECVRWTQLF
jgi:hypothetical protein